MHNVTGYSEIKNYLGYWPEFCDSDIEEFHLVRNNISQTSLEIVFRYIDSDLHKELLISVGFLEAYNLCINDISENNVFDKLDINESDKGYRVVFEACSGLTGSLNCKSIVFKVLGKV